MNRQQIVLIVCGALMAVVCVGAGWFLFSAMAVRSAAAEERNQDFESLKSIYDANVFPNETNMTRVSEDQKALEAWLVTASNLLHKGDLQVEQLTPTGFKQKLQKTVRDLSSQAGSVNGKVVASGFNFGFDKYLGQSDSLPTSENVERLSQQLTVIDLLCKELYAANILSLDKVTRETFDDVKVDAAQEEPSAPRRSKRRKDRDAAASDRPEPKAAAGATGEFFSKERYALEFQARPAAFIDVLNRLAAMNLFVVVAETEFRKTSDPLAKRATVRKPEATADNPSAVVDLATVPHAERIVTDPELEPPVSVKLEIDVYSFEGV